MSYFVDGHAQCPYCSAPRPAFARAKTPRWELSIPPDTTECALPHRLFYPFSFEHHDDTQYEAVLDFVKKTAQPVRGTEPLPPDLSIAFVGAEK